MLLVDAAAARLSRHSRQSNNGEYRDRRLQELTEEGDRTRAALTPLERYEPSHLEAALDLPPTIESRARAESAIQFASNSDHHLRGWAWN
jgi:hypothetical protein